SVTPGVSTSVVMVQFPRTVPRQPHYRAISSLFAHHAAYHPETAPQITLVCDGRMRMIGLTGGIGAGKSAVAARFAEHGAVVVDADKLAREVVEPGTDGLAQVV